VISIYTTASTLSYGGAGDFARHDKLTRAYELESKSWTEFPTRVIPSEARNLTIEMRVTRVGWVIN
jgi:hypothetical protein